MVMRKKVLVIGANGALGTDLVQALENPAPAVHADFDIRDKDRTFSWIKSSGAEAVINTAAFHRVPDCETEYAKAFEINAIGVRNLAEICADLKIHICHLSTDYVFDGSKQAPYTEEDVPAPLSIYAITKHAGEQVLAAYGDNYSIVRSCGLYGKVPTRAKGGNFVNTMMKLGAAREKVTVVSDETVCPTYTHDLAKGIVALLNSGGRGVFHITQSGETSWFAFSKVIFDYFKLPAKLEPISSSDFQSKVRRPVYSILDNAKFVKTTGHKMPHWKEALLRFLREIEAPGK